jgi:hypothetical protein
MMAVSDASLILAIRNVAQHGDTDVYPYPLENHWFHDDESAVLELLKTIDQRFDEYLGSYPVIYVTSLSPVGYAGFRGATQIDPIWNAYLLALVIEIGADLENARLPPSDGITFSYRFHPSREAATLFDADLGWASFQRTALHKAEERQVVVSTDISDFYPRVYHHRLEHALNDATHNTEVVRRILLILAKLVPGEVSFGLPIGGHAARILAEILLNRTDRLLRTDGIEFCRFVDDYYVFANTREEAHAALIHLSDVLLNNEGLTLSRLKTRFMSRSEFLRSSPMADPDSADSVEERESRRFLKLRLRYDPYSASADEDYEKLSQGIAEFDVIGMLTRELRKTRVDERLVRQLVKSLKFLDNPVRDDAAISLVRNLEVLYPVFPTVALVLKSILPDLGEPARTEVAEAFRALIQAGSYITLVPTNLAYAVRVISLDPSEEATTVLAQIYAREGVNVLVKRDVLLAMAKRRARFWLSPIAKQFGKLSSWERRALIPASFVLGDEGEHWRRNVRRQLNIVDLAFRDWVAEKNNGRRWEIPL